MQIKWTLSFNAPKKWKRRFKGYVNQTEEVKNMAELREALYWGSILLVSLLCLPLVK